MKPVAKSVTRSGPSIRESTSVIDMKAIPSGMYRVSLRFVCSSRRTTYLFTRRQVLVASTVALLVWIMACMFSICRA